MIIAITQKQKEFLFNVLLKYNSNLFELVKQNCFPYFNKYKIIVSDEIGSDLRDLCEDALIKIGFDEAYNLNENGKILEDLSDLIYQSSMYQTTLY